MTSLAEAAAIAELVDILYPLLPATFSPVTFGTVAARMGVAEYWPPEKISKGPRIRALLDGVLTRRRERFCPLIEAVVAAGLTYRRGKGNPIQRDEVTRLNASLLKLKFKIPGLHDPAFLDSLASGASDARTESTGATSERTSALMARQVRLDQLKSSFLRLSADDNRQAAGIAFQGVLQNLFDIFELQLENPFRVIGEEIDGAFYFEKESYLLEAKWTTKPVGAAPLYTFDTKIRRKSRYTRGVFVSVNGYSDEALAAVRTGDSIRFIMLDGGHLFRVLDGCVPLDELLLSAWRHFAARGYPYVPVSDMVNLE